MLTQAPGSILMVRPSNFGFNPLTASSNAFQKKDTTTSTTEINLLARKEFDYFTNQLIKANIEVLIFEDHKNLILPDSVFPNNWISLHHDGTVVLYPLMAENRRQEKRKEMLLRLQNKYHFNINRVLDYSSYETNGQFLEGTGSVVFDYMHKIAYANTSPRTDAHLFHQLCQDLGFEGILFKALGPSGKDIYHTNVMMCLGSGFAVVCLETVVTASMRSTLSESFERTNHEILPINISQMAGFAGNMIEVLNKVGEPVLVMSTTAYQSLEKDQIRRLSHYGDILSIPIPVIEKSGGGSARCMIAGNFLPKL
jgi:hypothetical protein